MTNRRDFTSQNSAMRAVEEAKTKGLNARWYKVRYNKRTIYRVETEGVA